MEARDYIQALIDAGLTQTEIDRRTGIPQTTVSKILRGETQDVMSRTYRRLQALHAEVCAQTPGGRGEAETPAASTVGG